MQLPGSQRERAANARLHMPDLAKHASAYESLQEMMPQLVALQRIDYRQTHRVWRCRFICYGPGDAQVLHNRADEKGAQQGDTRIYSIHTLADSTKERA